MFRKFAHVVEHIDISPGALGRLPAWAAQKGYGRLLVVSDVNTRRAAGEALCAALKAGGLPYGEIVFPDEHLRADETALGRLTAAYTPDVDLVVSVGSGTLGDLGKFLAWRVGRPLAWAATAPSMDGFASAGAAMLLNGVKVTPHTRAPQALFCDPDILRLAPVELIAAGFGDMLGKYSAQADWKLAQMLAGERFDAELASLVDMAVQRCVASAEGVQAREAGAVMSLVEGLILSGIAMTMFGDSHPASGAEHHLSHFWEMRQIARGAEYALHGRQVGVATLCALRLWEMLPVIPEPPPPEDRAATLARVRAAYGAAAETICVRENPNVAFDKIQQNWPHVRRLAGSLPPAGDIEATLGLFGAPVRPDDIGVDEALLYDSVTLARERKKVYTVLQLLGDLGLLDDAARRLNASFRPAGATGEE